MTWDAIKDMKTVGVIREDEARGITEVAVPMGVVAALIPPTNPTSTVLYKTIISLKAGNAIVISPPPGAKNCILEAWRIASEAAKRAGAPDGLVQCITTPTVDATNALLKSRDNGIILATGGEAMVRAAYSSGNPALGVGPGNGRPSLRNPPTSPPPSAAFWTARPFDNGTICRQRAEHRPPRSASRTRSLTSASARGTTSSPRRSRRRSPALSSGPTAP